MSDSKKTEPKKKSQRQLRAERDARVEALAREIAEKGFVGSSSYFPVAVAAIERGL